MTNFIHSVEVDIEYPFFQGHFLILWISVKIFKHIKHKKMDSLARGCICVLWPWPSHNTEEVCCCYRPVLQWSTVWVRSVIISWQKTLTISCLVLFTFLQLYWLILTSINDGTKLSSFSSIFMTKSIPKSYHRQYQSDVILCDGLVSPKSCWERGHVHCKLYFQTSETHLCA